MAEATTSKTAIAAIAAIATADFIEGRVFSLRSPKSTHAVLVALTPLLA